MKTPRTGGRYKRHAGGTITPVDQASATKTTERPASKPNPAESAVTGNDADSEKPQEDN